MFTIIADNFDKNTLEYDAHWKPRGKNHFISLLERNNISYTVISESNSNLLNTLYVINFNHLLNSTREKLSDFKLSNNILKNIKDNKIKLIFYFSEENIFYNSKYIFNFIKRYNLEDNFYFISGSKFNTNNTNNLAKYDIIYDEKRFFFLDLFSFEIQDALKKSKISEKLVLPIKKKFVCPINKMREGRIYILYNLIKNDLLRYGHISAGVFKTNHTYTDKSKLEHWLKLWYNDTADDILNDILTICNDYLPKDLDPKNTPQKRLILDNGNYLQIGDNQYIKSLESLEKFYKESLFALTIETDSNFKSDKSNYIQITEKTYLPIIFKKPFAIIGSKYTLKTLNEMGYQTFPFLFSEIYDELSDLERVKIIIKDVKKLCLMNNDKLNKLIHLTKEITEFNYTHFININHRNKISNIIQKIIKHDE